MKVAMISTVVVAALIAGCAGSKDLRATSVQGSAMTAEVAAPKVVRAAIAPALYELAYSPKQRAVFVASVGSQGEGTATPKIFRLNPDTLAVEAEIALDFPGLGVTLDDDNNRLYVGNAFDAAVTVIDTRTNHVVGVAKLAEKVNALGFDGKPTVRYPHNLRELLVDNTTGRLFAPGIWIDDSSLYVVNLKTLAVEKVMPGFGFGAAGVTMDPKLGKVYVANMQGQVFVVDAKTLELDRVMEVQADQLLNMVFDNKAGRILAIDQGGANVDGVRANLAKLDYKPRGTGNRVVVINPATGEVEKSIPTGTGPVNLVLDEERGHLYVTNRVSGTVTVYDRNDNDRELHSVAVPDFPNTPRLDPQTGAVYVSIKNGEQAGKGSNESVAKLTFE